MNNLNGTKNKFSGGGRGLARLHRAVLALRHTPFLLLCFFFSLSFFNAASSFAAVTSTASVKTDVDAIDLLSSQTEGNTAKFMQDYMYTGNDRTASLSARTSVVRADPGAKPVPVAKYTAQASVIRLGTGKIAPLPAVSPGSSVLKTAATDGAKAGKLITFSPVRAWGDIVAAFNGLGARISSGFEKAKSAVSDKLLGKGRGLTPEELAAAQQVYGDKMDYSKVKIVTGDGLNWFSRTVLTKSYRLVDGKLQTTPAGVTLGNRIYFPNDADGKSLYSFSTGSAWFIHETCHTYQYNAQGIGYMFKSMVGQMKDGNDFYNYQLEAGKAFGKYNVEQQARLVEHYYQIVNGKRSVTAEERAVYDEIMTGEGLYPGVGK
ncbi:MAG: hypothetical protein A2285_03675 [Elusimicrobia bacterium RIFOXYA12_FULL_57_11]|nr:MAG: hypothetical protein A2285_03675 [Elusimicrobia bacterium RIFOXYA12_FULL_57_11]